MKRIVISILLVALISDTKISYSMDGARTPGDGVPVAGSGGDGSGAGTPGDGVPPAVQGGAGGEIQNATYDENEYRRIIHNHLYESPIISTLHLVVDFFKSGFGLKSQTVQSFHDQRIIKKLDKLSSSLTINTNFDTALAKESKIYDGSKTLYKDTDALLSNRTKRSIQAWKLQQEFKQQQNNH